MIVQDAIVLHLQQHGGMIAVDDEDVADLIGGGIDVPGDRVRSALGALEARGFLTANYFHAELTDKGRAYVVVDEAPAALEDARRSGPVLVDVSAGAGRVAERESAGAGSAVSSPAPVPAQMSGVPDRPKEAGMATRTGPTIRERIVDALEMLGGRIDDGDGHARRKLAEVVADPALPGNSATVAVTIDKLIRDGVLRKVSNGGRSVTSIVLAKGATNGSVSKLQGADRVGSNGGRSNGSPRREARAPARAKAAKRGAGGRRGTARKAPARRGRRRDGDARGVDQPLRDVPVRGSAPQDELVAIGRIVEAFGELSPHGRRYVASLLGSHEERG